MALVEEALLSALVCHKVGSHRIMNREHDESGQERFLHQGHCRIHCPRGFYPDRAHRACLPCITNCELCNDAYVCAKCWEHYTILNGVCSAPCTDCRDASHCLACQRGYFLHDRECVKQCPGEMFADAAGWRCLPCHSSCRTCRGPHATHCDSCVGGSTAVYGQCPLDNCPQGQYASGDLLDQESSCVQQCPLGSYANTSSQLCEACSPNCEGCLGSKDVCTSCSTSTYIFLHQGRCWSNCPEGFFETAGGSCDSCDESCLACDGSPTQCLSCGAGRFLEAGACRPNCSLRTYASEDGTCRRCPPHCDVCGDERTCLRCSFLYLILNGGCKASCPQGYYDDMEDGRCGACHPTCGTCSGPLADDCEKCADATLKLYDGVCAKDCPPETYYETTAMECQECHQTCARCSGPEASQCSQCERGLVLDPNSLLCGVTGDTACPTGTYLHEDHFTCIACHHQCRSCGGPGRGQCLSQHLLGWVPSRDVQQQHPAGCGGSCFYATLLFPMYYSEGSSCEQCDPSCEQCTGPGSESCRACSAPLLELQGTRLCVERCPHRFYQRNAGSACHRCHISCQTCTDASPQSCVTCDRGSTLKDNVCYPRCGEGLYYTQEDVCKACHSSCRHCAGPGPAHCLSCPSESGLHAVESRCAPCCQTRGNDTDCSLCTEAPPLPRVGDPDVAAASAEPSGSGGHASAALPAALLLVLGTALAVFALLKARAKKRLCWRRSYERLSGGGGVGAMPHGVPEPDSGDEADVVYTTKGLAAIRERWGMEVNRRAMDCMSDSSYLTLAGFDPGTDGIRCRVAHRSPLMMAKQPGRSSRYSGGIGR
ncbi:hypothetical protein CRUP_018612 [Coryphaenoides rupestris]|nr:hypothetical protein CRUP_018612 [Coryphaenoides rupestris]